MTTQAACVRASVSILMTGYDMSAFRSFPFYRKVIPTVGNAKDGASPKPEGLSVIHIGDNLGSVNDGQVEVKAAPIGALRTATFQAGGQRAKPDAPQPLHTPLFQYAL